MRMWKVPPKIMCNQHLLGEHLEMHMFIGCLRKGKSLRGYIKGGLVEVDQIINRHGDLALEMIARGIYHKSLIPDCMRLLLRPEGIVDVENSVRLLWKRCPNCRKRIKQYEMVDVVKRANLEVV